MSGVDASLRSIAKLSVLLSLTQTAYAQEASGFVELRAAYSVGVDGEPVQFIERFRPTFEAPFGERVSLSSTIELGFVQGRATQKEFERTIDENERLNALFNFAGCEWPVQENSFLGIDGAGDYLSVSRLFVDWYHPSFDLRVGRQALQWGSGQFVNPTDPFPQVLLTEPWKPRRGVNAVRMTIPFGDLNQVQAVIGTNDAFDKVRAAARATVVAAQTDFALVTAYRQESDELMTGLDIRGTLGVGFWAEGSLHFKEVFDPDEDMRLEGQLVLGIDYSFPVFDSFIVMLQYYRNSAGSADGTNSTPATAAFSAIQAPVCGDDVGALFGASDAEVDPFAPFFSGRDYGLIAVNATFIPELSMSVAALQNFNDGTGILIPTVTTAPFGAVTIALSGQIPYAMWGDGGEFRPNPDSLVLEIPIDPALDPITLDMSGLVPSATIILWTRANF